MTRPKPGIRNDLGAIAQVGFLNLWLIMLERREQLYQWSQSFKQVRTIGKLVSCLNSGRLFGFLRCLTFTIEPIAMTAYNQDIYYS